MEGQYAQHHPQQYGGPAPFFHYHPDAPQDTRQQGHFAPQPQMPYVHHEGYPHHEQMIPIYHPQMQYQKPQQFHQLPMFHSQPLMTPVASPQPIQQKPTVLVQQESPFLFPLDTDCYAAPSTPPLSSSGSAVSSPPSACDILPTPIGGFPINANGIQGVKQGCEGEVFTEILASAEFTGPASPAMTPGEYGSSFSEPLTTFCTRRCRSEVAFCVTSSTLEGAV